MTKNKYLTNQQFLQELAKRLPEFTERDFFTLMEIISPYQQKVLKVIQDLNPQIHHWIQEKHQQLESEKTDKEVEKIKKSLAKK